MQICFSLVTILIMTEMYSKIFLTAALMPAALTGAMDDTRSSINTPLGGYFDPKIENTPQGGYETSFFHTYLCNDFKKYKLLTIKNFNS